MRLPAPALALALALASPPSSAQSWPGLFDAPAAEKLASVKELLAFVDACGSGQSAGPAEKDRAWKALWRSEDALSPRVVELLRALLLDLDEKSGPLQGLARAVPAPPGPSAAEARERVRLINAALDLNYPPETLALIAVIARRAELADARTALEVLRRDRPVIELESEGMDYASVGLLSEDGKSRPLIRLKAGVALVPAASEDRDLLQLSDGARRYYPVPGSQGDYLRLGLAAPPWQALRSGEAPERKVSYYGGELRLYADGSGAHRFSQGHLAGVLLHELFHLDTRRRGGAANVEVKELRSFLPQYRLYYNLQRALGSADFLDLNLQGYERWLRSPVSLGYMLEAAYSGQAEAAGPLDERPVFRQISETAQELALGGGDFARLQSQARAERLGAVARREAAELSYLAHVGAVPREAQELAKRRLEKLKAVEAADAEGWDYRRKLQESLARLPVDAELELEAKLEDWSWRRMRADQPSNPGISGAGAGQ